MAAIQNVLSSQLEPSGTGAYAIPDPKQSQTQGLLEKGPQATVFFEEGGLGHLASNSPIGGFLLCVLTGLLLAAALGSTASRTNWSDRVKLVILFALAFTVYRDLGEPIFNAYGWTFFVVQFAQDMVALVAAGLVIGQWYRSEHSGAVIPTRNATCRFKPEVVGLRNPTTQKSTATACCLRILSS